jgi:hypothetical protein
LEGEREFWKKSLRREVIESEYSKSRVRGGGMLLL